MTMEAAQIGAVARGGTRAEAWWAFPAVPLLAAAIGFTWMLHGMLQRAYGMTGEAWDLAYDQQVIWNVSQGHGFYSSFARADFLGIHLELIFGALAAIEKLWPSPIVLFILYLAGAWFLIGTGIVQQHFRNGGYTDFVYYRWLFGLDPSHPVSPLAVAQALVRPEALAILAAIIASMFALPLLAPRWLLLVIPPYLANVLSAHVPQNALHLPYVLLLVFPLMVAGGIGARRLLTRMSVRPALALLAAVPALILGLGMGRFPPALLSHQNLYSRPNSVSQPATATSTIPRDAPVNADAGLCVWLANRHTINDFPDMLEAGSYVVIDSDYYLGNNTTRAKRQATADAIPTSGRRLLYDAGRFQVWSPVGD